MGMSDRAPSGVQAIVFAPLAPAATWTEQATWADAALARLTAVHGERWDIWYLATYPWGYCWNAKPRGERLAEINVNTPEALEAEIKRKEARPARARDLSGLAPDELKRINRELAAAAGLAREGSGGRVMILTEMQAIEAELDRRQSIHPDWAMTVDADSLSELETRIKEQEQYEQGAA